MARTWLSVTVELLGGRGSELWPWPGRVFAIGPSHTFQQFADAINTAFARWDRSHLSMFTLADGRVVADEETGAEMTAAPIGPVLAPLKILTARVSETVAPGAEFQFTFDLGDNWTHRCLVGPEKIDPYQVLGVLPDRPLPYWGWGDIPDQYGRRWADDDGQSRSPRRPSGTHPMLLRAWPGRQQVRTLDLTEVRVATAEHDIDRFISAVSGADIDDALQQVGTAIAVFLETADERVEPVAASVINRLTRRGWIGDDVLAEELTARLRRKPLEGRVVPVDLESLGMEMEGDASMSSGGYLDLHTGEVYDDTDTDPRMVGEDAAIDVDEDPDRWLRIDRAGSHAGWQDMSDFADKQRDYVLRNRMQQAIDGKGAFRRFRDLVHGEGLAESWYAFAADRQLGRARAFLAAEGLRAGPRSTPSRGSSFAPGQR